MSLKAWMGPVCKPLPAGPRSPTPRGLRGRWSHGCLARQGGPAHDGGWSGLSRGVRVRRPQGTPPVSGAAPQTAAGARPAGAAACVGCPPPRPPPLDPRLAGCPGGRRRTPQSGPCTAAASAPQRRGRRGAPHREGHQQTPLRLASRGRGLPASVSRRPPAAAEPAEEEGSPPRGSLCSRSCLLPGSDCSALGSRPLGAGQAGRLQRRGPGGLPAAPPGPDGVTSGRSFPAPGPVP